MLIWEISLFRIFRLSKAITESRRVDSNRFPAHYEGAVCGCCELQRFANLPHLRRFLCSVLPTIAGQCIRVRVKLGSSGVSSPWITRRRRFLCTRCASRDGDGLPTTGRVTARRNSPPPTLHWRCPVDHRRHARVHGQNTPRPRLRATLTPGKSRWSGFRNTAPARRWRQASAGLGRSTRRASG